MPPSTQEMIFSLSLRWILPLLPQIAARPKIVLCLNHVGLIVVVKLRNVNRDYLAFGYSTACF